MSTLIVVDCEAPFGVGAPSVGDMTEFGAVDVNALREGREETFHGTDCSEDTFRRFREWLAPRMPVVFVSDNPAYDLQWINFYFWKYLGENPFGHSGRRIADFYAGLVGDFCSTQRWKRLRRTKHDHHPVHDALGNAEALIRILDGERYPLHRRVPRPGSHGRPVRSRPGLRIHEGAEKPTRLWNLVVERLATMNVTRVDLLGGFLEGLQICDVSLAHTLLDRALDDPTLAAWLPVLQTSVGIDRKSAA